MANPMASLLYQSGAASRSCCICSGKQNRYQCLSTRRFLWGVRASLDVELQNPWYDSRRVRLGWRLYTSCRMECGARAGRSYRWLQRRNVRWRSGS